MQRFDDPLLVFASKCLQRDLQLYSCISVDADKLIVIQTDDITLFFSNNGRHAAPVHPAYPEAVQNRENTISLQLIRAALLKTW